MRVESPETNRVSDRGNQHSDAPNLDPLLRLDSERQRNDPAQTRNEIASLHPEPAPDAPNPSVRNFRHRPNRLESVQGHSRPKWAVHAMSGQPLFATKLRTSLEIRIVPT